MPRNRAEEFKLVLADRRVVAAGSLQHREAHIREKSLQSDIGYWIVFQETTQNFVGEYCAWSRCAEQCGFREPARPCGVGAPHAIVHGAAALEKTDAGCGQFARLRPALYQRAYH
ncbi:MAG: hypothetical protein WA280_19880 [Xanthobacteraceae bacterium]